MKENDYFFYNTLHDHVLSLMPPYPINYVVTKEQQDKEIASLKETIGSRRFFFITNLENFEIEQAAGLERWLGYSSKDLTMKQYLDKIVHRGRRKSMIVLARQIYDTLCSGTHVLNFMVQRFKSQVVLQHRNGTYLLALKISSVFQYDTKNRLTAYLNEFTIIGDYTDQAMNPDFFTSGGDEERRGDEILQKTIEQFLHLRVFAEREFQIARKMAYEPGCTKMQIGDDLGIATYTVDEYGRRFLTKAREFFDKDFSSVAEAAIYLKNEGLL